MNKMWFERQAALDSGAIEQERDCPRYKPREDKKLRGITTIREVMNYRMSYMVSCLKSDISFTPKDKASLY